MKNRLIGQFFTIILLVTVFANLSCSDTPQNNTANYDVTRNENVRNNSVQNSNTPLDPPSNDPDCSGDAPVKQKKIKDGIKADIDKFAALKNQHPKNFDYEPIVDASKGDATLYIWGSIFTSRKDLDELNKTYKSFMKKGCLTKIVFAPSPTAKVSAAPFEFNLCEAPSNVCSDGTCRQNCLVTLTDANANANANTSTNMSN